jgi:superfamily II DNA or RNA helicase
MIMELVLRAHQTTILDKLRNGFSAGYRAQVLYGPCAFGKTEVAISMMHAAAQKGRRSAMVLDRRVLCTQTSARLWKYGIDHGVMMAGSDRWRPDQRIQICTAQTLEKREGFPGVDLLIIDEAHCIRKETAEFIKNNPSVKVIGLSGSPFTKGMGAVYSSVESAVTIDELVAQGWLIAPRVFIATEIDMTGARKVAGEWSAAETTKRGIQITGDIVAEWVAKTNEIFGGPRKTIVFCSGVAHGEDLSRKFAEAGYNFISISYKDDDDYKQQVLEEFNKPDTDINGIIATDILTKGFDQSDVMIGVSARPFSKSFSSHVQQIGRVMRTFEGKTQAIWLDHSGNYLRFRDQWDDLCANGVSELDDDAEKPKPEPSTLEKEKARCPRCGSLWPSRSDTCSHCGHMRARRSEVIETAGEMHELGGNNANRKHSAEYKADFYAQLLGFAEARGYKPGYAFFAYKDKFGVQPSMTKPAPQTPKLEVINFLRSRQIARAKMAQKVAA